MTQIIPLSEGTFTVGRDKMFAPFDLNKDELNDRSRGSLLVEVQPFIIVNDKDIILLDTGLGFNHPDGANHLISNLAKHNILPEDVTKILMSHLHKDHAGGLNPDIFYNAQIYIYKPELEFAYEKGKPSYFPEELDKLNWAENVVQLEATEGVIDEYIRYWHTDGHSPQHIVFLIDDPDGPIFYGGDEAPQHKQMIVKYVAKYDYNGKRAMELREEWMQKGKEGNWRFLFYHDIATPIKQYS
jgi:glyoxylase-like metal-dependent hydrolase (beta-lactamase superfamily II)